MKIDVRKTNNKAIDLNVITKSELTQQDIKNVRSRYKIMIGITNKKEKDKKGDFVEAFSDMDAFLDVIQDVLDEKFDERHKVLDKDTKAHLKDANGNFRYEYTERKGGENIKTKKLESRVFTISHQNQMDNPWLVSIARGKGKRINKGAVTMDGRAELRCDFRFSDSEFRRFCRRGKLVIERLLSDEFSSKVIEEFEAMKKKKDSSNQSSETEFKEIDSEPSYDDDSGESVSNGNLEPTHEQEIPAIESGFNFSFIKN